MKYIPIQTKYGIGVGCMLLALIFGSNLGAIAQIAPTPTLDPTTVTPAPRDRQLTRIAPMRPPVTTVQASQTNAISTVVELPAIADTYLASERPDENFGGDALFLGYNFFGDRYGDAWVWLASAPESRLILAFVVGERSQASANLLLERVKFVSDALLPFFTSDQLPAYPIALLHVYGEWMQPQRQGTCGPHPKPRKVPPTNLYNAQVVKKRENGRVVDVSTKAVFGHPAVIQLLLAASATSDAVNTSFFERQNLTMRQRNRRLTRKTNGFSKELAWFEKQLWLSSAYYHFVLPHDSLKVPLVEPLATKGAGSRKRWAPVTPAMQAGITDHVWTISELLSFRVPFSFLDAVDELERLFPQSSVVFLPDVVDDRLDVNFYCDP